MYGVLSSPMNKLTNNTFKLLNSWYVVGGSPEGAITDPDTGLAFTDPDTGETITDPDA